MKYASSQHVGGFTVGHLKNYDVCRSVHIWRIICTVFMQASLSFLKVEKDRTCIVVWSLPFEEYATGVLYFLTILQTETICANYDYSSTRVYMYKHQDRM